MPTNFFQLTHPTYVTDTEDSACNPVVTVVEYAVPGVICDRCGPWASSDRIRDARLSAAPRELRRSGHGVGVMLPFEEWRRRMPHWASTLGVDPTRITPGAELGPPMGRVSANIACDVVHPAPGRVWVKRPVKDALERAHLAGFALSPVSIRGLAPADALWEIEPHGHAWRKGRNRDAAVLCEICGRMGFPNPRVLAVDEATWDGSDFLTLDLNPNILIVTERVRAVLADRRFSNVAFLAALKLEAGD